MAYVVYLLQAKSTAYIGVTTDIVRRVYEHRSKSVDGFTKRYDVDKLVWFETYDDIASAITREKELKKWAARLEDSSGRGRKSELDRP